MRLMLDLETMGLNPNCVVLSIGVAAFDNNNVVSKFYARIDDKEQFGRGRTIDTSVQEWWDKQLPDAKKVFAEPVIGVDDALSQLTGYVRRYAGAEIWGNGCHFDVSIMEDMYRMYGMQVPWSFRDVRDLRTFAQYVAKGAKVPRGGGVHHNALDDAIAQANYVIQHSKPKVEVVIDNTPKKISRRSF